MCGIVGYVGDRDCADVLVDALSKLEYRGYDSAGIAVVEKGVIKVEKCKGRLANLVDKMAVDGKPQGHCGIGHTRWATHGEPSDINSHPHGNKRVSIVHNGIIENYKQIKDFLIEEGYSFVSETDTETVAKLLDYYYVDDPVDTIIKVLSEIKGSYALGIMFRDYPDTVFAVRKECPLIVGVGENENFLASDVPAIIKYTRDYYLLEANEIKKIELIVNRLRMDMVKRGDMMSIEDLIGAVPDDEQIVISTNQGEPLVGSDSLAGQAYLNICKRIMGEEVPLLDLESKNGVWSKFVSLFKKN